MCNCSQHTGQVTLDEIEAARTPAGGWTRAQLAAWGVPWPPAKGWKDRLTGAYCAHCHDHGLIHDDEYQEGGYHHREASARLDLATERGCLMRDIPDADVTQRLRETQGES